MRYFKIIQPFSNNKLIYITDDDISVGIWYNNYIKYKNINYRLELVDIANLNNAEGCKNPFKEITDGELFLEIL